MNKGFVVLCAAAAAFASIAPASAETV